MKTLEQLAREAGMTVCDYLVDEPSLVLAASNAVFRESLARFRAAVMEEAAVIVENVGISENAEYTGGFREELAAAIRQAAKQ